MGFPTARDAEEAAAGGERWSNTRCVACGYYAPCQCPGNPHGSTPAEFAADLVAIRQRGDDLPDLDPYQVAATLDGLSQLGGTIRDLTDELVWRARQDGASWRELGTLLGVHFTSAKERYERIERERRDVDARRTEAARVDSTAPGADWVARRYLEAEDEMIADRRADLDPNRDEADQP
jgi:hypothetical protein